MKLLKPYLIIALAGLMLTLPLIIYGLPFSSDDGVYHVIYFENFSRQLWSGELYPRWLIDMYGGLGGPTFFYYPPLVYYFSSLFSPLPISVWHQLGLSASLGLVLSGFTAFLWLKDIGSKRSALFAALIFMLLPYHVNFDLYVRGAIAESFAFVWMPLILFFVGRMVRGGRLAFLGLAVAYAALCSTHLLTTLVFSVVPIVYSVFLGDVKYRFRALYTTLAAMALGAGLSAIYIVPALSYREYAFFNEMTEGLFDYERGLFSTSTVLYGSRRHFWIIFQVGLVAFACYLAGRSNNAPGINRQRTCWLIISLGCVFMMTYLSYPVWALITPLQMIQFPFRFNTVLSIALLPLISVGLSSVKRPLRPQALLMLVTLGFFCILWVQDIGRVSWISFIRPPSQSASFEAKKKHYRLNMDSHGMWPRSVPASVYELDSSLAKIPQAAGRPVKAYISSGSGAVDVSRWHAREIKFTIDTPAGADVVVSQFYYPGWTARIASVAENLPIRATDDLGLVSITVPPGIHEVELKLVKLTAESAGEWISLASASVILILFLVLFPYRKYRQSLIGL